ncbi:MmgE/PrpD family protein [Pseudochelatococcus sp. B33]
MTTSPNLPASVISSISDWAAWVRKFSPLARQRAGDAILDTVGCIVAGARNEATVIARETLGVAGSGYSVVGGWVAVPGHAALINGTSAHALDFDDTFRPLMGHASAVLVPALLAAAEKRKISGADLIDGYLVGLEAQALLGAGMNPGHYAAGWHATATIGAIGAAAGVARLMELDTTGIANSMSLACSMASGTKAQFGSPIKPLHAGLCARNAVEAALMGKSGMKGRNDVVEHKFGLQRLYAGQGTPWANVLRMIGGTHSIEAIGLTPKRFPCCAASHKVLDMVLNLKNLHGFGADDVIQIDTLVGSINQANLPYAEPDNEMQAKFSMNFCVALALVQGQLRIADFTPAGLARPEVRRLMPLVRMRAYTPEEENGGVNLPHKVSIRLSDGRILSDERLLQKGSISEPFDEASRLDKFRDCCAGYLSPNATEKLLEGLRSCDDISDISFLFQHLRRV